VVVEAIMRFEERMQRTTIVLAVLAVALAAFIGFYEKGTLSSGELAERRGRLLTRFVRNRVDRVVIDREEGRVVLVRVREDEEEVGEWNLVEPMEWPADIDAVDALLGALEWASARRTLEGIDEEDRSRFGFDEPRLTASFTAADQEVPLVFGGEDALQSGLYVTLDDPTTAYVVGQDLFEALDHDAGHFRDRALLSRFGTSTVNVLEIEDAEDTRRIERRDQRFHLEAPVRGLASGPRVREILRALGELTASRFVDEAPSDLSTYGLDAPVRTVRLEREALADQVGELVVRFGGPCEEEEGELYVRVDDGPVVCAPDVEGLATPVAELRESRLVTTDETDLERLTIEQGGRTLVLERDPEELTFTLRGAGDESVDVDDDALAEFMRELRSVRATGYREGSGEPLSQPWLTLSFVGADDELLEEVRVGRPSATGLVATRGDEPVVITLAPEAAEVLTISTLRFRTRRLVEEDVDEAAYVDVEGEVHQTVERDGLVWRLTEPFSAEAERPAVRDAVREVASLEAVRYEAESASPSHGLGRIRATFRFETSDEDDDGHDHDDGDDDDERPAERTYTIQIGADTDDGAFARLEGDPAVFVVTRAVVDALDADFVSRAVLSTELDELAGVAIEREGLSVTLTKEDDGWHTADGGLADRERTRALGDAVALIRVAEVAGYGRPRPNFGLRAPRVRLTVSRRASAAPPSSYTIVVGAEASGEGTPRTYVRRDDLDATFLVPSEAVELFSTYTP
jgi:hypothetical protein